MEYSLGNLATLTSIGHNQFQAPVFSSLWGTTSGLGGWTSLNVGMSLLGIEPMTKSLI
jgi:hypothetical protein